MSYSREELDSIDVERAKSLLQTIAHNVDNLKLSDADFRSFIRDSIPVTFTGDKYPAGMV